MTSSRTKWLLSILAILLLANGLYYLISTWGLITVHVKEAPLKDIVSSIERQGHISLVTNLDPERKVTMFVTKVPLMEALETLATITDSRWSLLYVIAPTQDKLQDGLKQVTLTDLPAEWKRVAVPLPPFVGVQLSEPVDPRLLRWRVEPPATTNLQDYLAQGALSADVTFLVPSEWNPAIPQPPATGLLPNVVQSLSSTANSTTREVFFLNEMRRPQRPPGEARPERPRDMWQNFDLARIDERIQQQIAQLPPEDQKEARESYDSRKAFFLSLATLTPEQRREKMIEFFQSPEAQERMESRDARRTPEQRASRNARYTQNRASIRGH